MVENRPFKVIIVGGSIAGLTLANMLQANNIDYVILEAYPNIAPQVGASIGLLPHGNRILDQLGVFDKILALSTPVDTFTFRNDTGSPIAACHGVNRSFVKRHGFPIVFLDRQTVLQVLYDNIRDKTKVLTKKRVSTVELHDDCATAIVADGTSYTGDIVIGADGIHSTVRGEMWKLANKLEPGSMDPSKAEEVSSDYSCIFGISSACPDVNPGDMNSIFREKASYLIIGGPKGRTYWFRFQKHPKRFHGSEIPRYTSDDAERAIKAALNENIIGDTKFATLIQNKICSSMTTLVEHVYDRWHFHRLMTVGDSAHKLHPIGGHGGNGAIETAATLTNLLAEALKASPTGRLTTAQLNSVFSRVQEIRHDRINTIKDYSHEQQRTESLDTFLRKITALHILPFVNDEDVMYNFSCQIPASEKLKMLPVQRQERLIPYKDELLCEPQHRGPYQLVLIAFYVTCAAVVYYGMWILPETWNLMPQMEDILQTGAYAADPSFKLLRSYTGIAPVDQYLVFLAVIFMPGLRSWSASFRMLQFYFLGNLTQPIAIWTVESCRKRNALTFLAIPSLWFVLFQSTGIGVYMPLYYAAYTWISNKEPYWWPLQRVVPMHYAKVLLSASLLGYALPTFLMFIPWGSSAAAQYTETFWQPSPLYVPVLTMAFGAFYSWRNPANPKSQLTMHGKDESADVSYLKQVYWVTGLLGTLVHWTFVLNLFNSDMTLTSIFIPDLSAGPKLLGDSLQNIFLVDFWGFVMASYVWCVSAVWDLKRVGRADVSVVNAALVIFAAHFVLGPGSVMSAVWCWREDVMALRAFPQKEKSHRD